VKNYLTGSLDQFLFDDEQGGVDMKNWEQQNTGHECECSDCGKPIGETEIRFVKKSFGQGRICVVCYNSRKFVTKWRQK
jgi:hypothetical protein